MFTDLVTLVHREKQSEDSGCGIILNSECRATFQEVTRACFLFYRFEGWYRPTLHTYTYPRDYLHSEFLNHGKGFYDWLVRRLVAKRRILRQNITKHKSCCSRLKFSQLCGQSILSLKSYFARMSWMRWRVGVQKFKHAGVGLQSVGQKPGSAWVTQCFLFDDRFIFLRIN